MIPITKKQRLILEAFIKAVSTRWLRGRFNGGVNQRIEESPQGTFNIDKIDALEVKDICSLLFGTQI